MVRLSIKGTFDFIFAAILLAALLPLLLIIAGIVYLTSGSPIFFRQLRPGKNMHPFELIKFRTMIPNTEITTPIGAFLRRYSLDELPQLINVLRSQMSFVGPRPLLMEYLPRYNDRQKNRHRVKPGMTGWAQINGRNAISWQEKFELDIYYVENYSFLLDLKILLITAKNVLMGKGVNFDKSITMPKFTGNENYNE